MSIFTKLHEKTVKLHLAAALVIAVILFTVGVLFGEYRYVCYRGVELCLGAVIEFLLFGSID